VPYLIYQQTLARYFIETVVTLGSNSF